MISRVTIFVVAACVLSCGGCVGSVRPGAALPRSGDPLDTILRMDPSANWTSCYNALASQRVAALESLFLRPELNRRCAPDDLPVLLATSLARLLLAPDVRVATRATALDVSLDLLHFDIKIDGRPLGELALLTPATPRSCLDLYPAEIDSGLASELNVDADRAAVLAAWRSAWSSLSRSAPPLRPQSTWLMAVLGRRYADRWRYDWVEKATLVSWTAQAPGGAPPLLICASYDYNLVRAACVWLGDRGDAADSATLIELVASPATVIAHNARFALQHSPNPRIRGLIEKYHRTKPSSPPDTMEIAGLPHDPRGLWRLEGRDPRALP